MFQEKPPKIASQAAERRTAKRHMSVFLLAKVTTEDRQSLGRVLNLSQTGAKIETRLSFTPGDPLVLEIRSDLKVAGTVRWVAVRRRPYRRNLSQSRRGCAGDDPGAGASPRQGHVVERNGHWDYVYQAIGFQGF